MGRRIHVASGLGACALAMAAFAGSTVTAAPGAAALVSHRPIAVIGANQSSNWSGYNQGSLEKGNELFKSIAGTWVVPTASQHKKGQAEYSSSWVGIGGGCVNTGCTVTDNTLIQAGTEQDVSAAGKASYYAWWEIIPEPETQVSLPVTAGNTVRVTITQTSQGQWSIVIKNLSSGRSTTVSTAYSSSYATAEWIEETPLIVGSGGGFAPLPNLTTVKFDLGLTNGANPKLTTAEEVQLVNSNSKVIAQPSRPDSDTDGFHDCAWATTCAAPPSS